MGFEIMRINIESVRKEDAANSIEVNYEIVDGEKNNYIDLLGAEKVESIKINGKIYNKNGLAAIDYEIIAKFLARCARCDKEMRQTLEIKGEKYIADESEDKDNGGDFYITETDGIVDIADFIVEISGVEIPYRYLCSEDCKGLCHKCGKDLNDGECPCLKKEKNPAFKILDDFFKE